MLATATAGTVGFAGASGRATTTGAFATAANRIFRLDYETVVGHIYLDFTGLFAQFLVYKEGQTSGLESFVFIIRLIQSQGQAWACSAASREIYADGGSVLVLEVAFKLLLGSFCNFEHVNFLLNVVGKRRGKVNRSNCQIESCRFSAHDVDHPVGMS